MSHHTSFTRRAVLAATTILPISAIRGSAANDAITVGLIGAGNRGPHVAAALQKATTGRVVAISDIIEARMTKTGEQLGVGASGFYQDYRRLLESNVDAVIIATPVHLHAEHFEAAVQAGKHIYIEKPAEVGVEGCKRIIRAADSADRRFHITFGFQRRHAHLYRKAHEMVKSGGAGEIRLATASFIKSEGAARQAAQTRPPTDEQERQDKWHAWKDLSGDLIVENNIHSIDVLNWFLGGHPLTAVGAGGTRLPDTGDVRDHNFVAYAYPNGTQAQLTGTTLATPGFREVRERFYGSKAMVETSENHLHVFYSRTNTTMEKPQRNMTEEAMEEFIKRIAEKRPQNNAIEGAESTLTAILGRMAMDAKREVTWDEMMRG
jgi:myo-inositol 2-dehydrogenase / D-chiro-inositol 1-dehydrogenase